MTLPDIRGVATEILRQSKIDYLDMSLWDYTIEPSDEAFKGRSLMSIFTEIPRGDVRLGVAGKIRHAEDALAVIEAGCDYAIVGRAAILRHDFPERVRRDHGYRSPELPVSPDHLAHEGLSPNFITYMRTFPGFVSDDAPAIQHDEVMKMWMKTDG